MQRQRIPVVLLLLLFVAIFVAPWVRQVLTPAVLIGPHFGYRATTPGELAAHYELLNDMRYVAEVASTSWSVVGYPPPLPELRAMVAPLVPTPLYEASVDPLHAFGLYYAVSFDGQHFTIEAYNAGGSRIGAVTGSRELNYSKLGNRSVHI